MRSAESGVFVWNEPAEVPAFGKTGYEALGRYIEFLPESGLVADARFTPRTPHLPYMSAND